MPVISSETVLQEVDHILASGSGILDFSVQGEDGYYTWRGVEDAEWSVVQVERVENTDEDRLILYPEGESFTCEIEANDEEYNQGPVRCYCE